MGRKWNRIFYHIFLVAVGSLVNIGWFYILKPQGLLLFIVPLIVFVFLGFFNRPGIMGFVDMVTVLVVSGFVIRLGNFNIRWLFFLNPVVLVLGIVGILAGYMLQGILKTPHNK